MSESAQLRLGRPPAQLVGGWELGLLILMAILALPNVMKAWRGIGSQEQHYYTVSAETRVSYAALYLGLAAFLAIMCEQLHAELPHAR